MRLRLDLFPRRKMSRPNGRPGFDPILLREPISRRFCSGIMNRGDPPCEIAPVGWETRHQHARTSKPIVRMIVRHHVGGDDRLARDVDARCTVRYGNTSRWTNARDSIPSNEDV